MQRELFGHLQALTDPAAGEQAIGSAARFATERLPCALPPGFEGRPLEQRRQVLMEQLNRPLRVCGMVKNEGEPGGGPFWVTGKDGGRSLQIVEEFQVDRGRTIRGASGRRRPTSTPSISSVASVISAAGSSSSSGSSIMSRSSCRRNLTRAATSRLSNSPGYGMAQWPFGTPSLSRFPSRPSTP